tara:strand:+ start:1436 stop:1669 length:234 start_codon:yes stop_codon:yes gene_type:complete
MCGGYYEEEFLLKGPKWKFENPTDLQRAVNICKRKLPVRSWRVLENQNIIEFENVKAEEMYSIAKAVAGSRWTGSDN